MDCVSVARRCRPTKRRICAGWACRKLWSRIHAGLCRPQFHALIPCESPKQNASSWFCSHTVLVPAKSNPFRNDGMASNPRIVRRAWRVLHLATDADTGRIVASVLTDKDADDGSQVGPLLDWIEGAVASVTGDGAYDRDDVYAEVAARYPATAVVVPPRANAVPSEAAASAPTQRDRHLRCIAECGRMGWQRAWGYGWRALVE